MAIRQAQSCCCKQPERRCSSQHSTGRLSRPRASVPACMHCARPAGHQSLPTTPPRPAPSHTHTHLLQQRLRAAAPLGRVLAVAHLHAGEAQRRVVALEHGHERQVAVPVPRVEVAGRELSRVRARLEPPVHPRQLDAQLAGRLELVDDVPVGRLRGRGSAGPRRGQALSAPHARVHHTLCSPSAPIQGGHVRQQHGLPGRGRRHVRAAAWVGVWAVRGAGALMLGQQAYAQCQQCRPAHATCAGRASDCHAA